MLSAIARGLVIGLVLMGLVWLVFVRPVARKADECERLGGLLVLAEQHGSVCVKVTVIPLRGDR